MANWSASMQQTYEFYVVDPTTWGDIEKIDTIVKCSITRDYDSETVYHATFEATSTLPECYVRVYLVVIQNGVKERVALGTLLVQTPSYSFNGYHHVYKIDAYSPLLELKNIYPPLGYTIPKNTSILSTVSALLSENSTAPVIAASSIDKMPVDYAADPSDSWLTYLWTALKYAKYRLNVDPMGNIIIEPIRTINELSPVFTYDDGNSSILLPQIDHERDLYKIPNTVEVLYSASTGYYRAVVENNDASSPVSIPNRGRVVAYRDTKPNLNGVASSAEVTRYAKELLKQLSSLEHSMSYSHGYNDVMVGQGVRLDYARAGMMDVRAQVVSQTIDCVIGCTVSEKAVYTENLWE